MYNKPIPPHLLQEVLTDAVAGMATKALLEQYEGATLEEVVESIQSDLASRPDLELPPVDWAAVLELAPRVESEDDGLYLSLEAVASHAVFWTRLWGRVAARGMLDHDAYLLGFLKCWGKAVMMLSDALGAEISVIADAFLHDLQNHGVNMAVMAGTLTPGYREGEYRTDHDVADGREADEVVGPWGLSEEAFTAMEFPFAHAIYAFIMDGVRDADACLVK